MEEAQATRATSADVIRAAGGVVARRRDAGLDVLLVHRPAYDDWTFPKGKALPGETDQACAFREVEEETGLICTLETELPSTVYRDAKGRKKRVRYWLMRPTTGELAFRHEVDDGRWLPLLEAAAQLTYARDTAVLAAVQPSSLTAE
jgi:8-oxo-dGTP pyrophosphatase MutT (NUDIX family)